MKVTKQGKEFNLITSWDDDGVDDLKLAELLRRYNIPAMFYIPSNARQLSISDIKFLSKSFEIGGHTINHRILRGIHLDEVYCELKDSKEWIEDLIGKEVYSLCYPRGRYNDKVISMARDIGYSEARTTKVLNLFEPDNKFEIITSAHVFNRKEYGGVYWFDVAMDLFNKVIEPSSEYDYFHLWGHSYELNKFNYWKDLEVLFAYMKEKLND